MNSFYKIPVEMVALEGIYRDFVFDFHIYAHDNYPYRQPKVYCENKILHPNINYDTGEVHVVMLKETEWIPSYSLNCLIFALELIILEPNLNCIPLINPNNVDAANLFNINRYEFEKLVNAYKVENQKIFNNGEMVFSRLENDLRRVKLKDGDMELEEPISENSVEEFKHSSYTATPVNEVAQRNELNDTPKLYSSSNFPRPDALRQMQGPLKLGFGPAYKRPRDDETLINPCLQKIKI